MKLNRIIVVLCLVALLCSCTYEGALNKSNIILSSKEDTSVQKFINEIELEGTEPKRVVPEIEIKNYEEEWGNIIANYGANFEVLTTGDSDSKYSNDTTQEKLYSDCADLVDNETALSELLIKHKKLSAEETLLLLNANTYTYEPDQMGYIIHTAISFTALTIGQDIAFIRTTNDFTNSDRRWGANGKRCYTVFESELGGYVYIFFDWYPEDTGLNSKLRRVFYCNREYTTNDISPIVDSKSVKQFVGLYPEFNGLEQIDNYGTIVNLSILLKDGAYIAATNKGANGKFLTSFLFKGDTIPPESGSENKADILDITILPQDYPPAS